MDTTEKNGQPSMEEILASIRRIIAEEPAGASPIIDLKSKVNSANSDPSLDEHSDFELPSIFRNPAPAAEKSTPLFGRLTDAIRGTATASADSKSAVRHADEVSASSTDKEQAGDASQAQFGTLSSLKGPRPEARDLPRASESPSDHPPAAAPRAASSTWSFGSRQASPPVKIEEEVKRVMAPFKDTHFLQMSNSQPAAEPAPPPGRPSLAASFPSPEPVTPPSRVDFSSIVPTRMDLPGVPGADHHPRSAASMGSELPQTPWSDRTVPPPPPEASASFFGTPPLQNPLAAEGHHSPFRTGAEPGHDAGPTGTIEDTTAELLRPMLRQWLADNMPRMVEKALHIEVAESVRTGKKLTGQ